MTREEFEEQYAAQSGLSVERLHGLGIRAEKCDCEDAECRGWAMVRDERTAG